MNNKLISFLEGHSCRIGLRKESITNIWNYSCFELENYHDYIQWLFPLTDQSMYNIFAPILTQTQIAYIKNNKEIQQSLKRSLIMMLDFYGFVLIDDYYNPYIDYAPTYKDKSSNWLSKNNHNYLRITRILKSLTLLGLRKYALAFFRILYEIYGATDIISNQTFIYWVEAIQKPNTE